MPTWHRIRFMGWERRAPGFECNGSPRDLCTLKAYLAEFRDWSYPDGHPDHRVKYCLLHDNRYGPWGRRTACEHAEDAARRLADLKHFEFLHVSYGYAYLEGHIDPRYGHRCCESTWLGWHCYTCGAQH